MKTDTARVRVKGLVVVSYKALKDFLIGSLTSQGGGGEVLKTHRDDDSQ